MQLTLEFGGGLELLCDSVKIHNVDIQLPKSQVEKFTMRDLLSWARTNLIKERPEMFMKGESVRPGVLVLVNDCDWELCGNLDATLEEMDVNAFVAPHWNMNAHSVMYITRGSARVQIVGNRGTTAFNGELRQGQLIAVLQNFALLMQARSQGFEWVAIKTNDNAMISPIVGKTSMPKGMPEEVLRNVYRVSREEARRLAFLAPGEELRLFWLQGKS